MQKKIIKQLHVQSVISPPKEIEQRVNFIKKYLLTSKKMGLIIGVSGGQDSTLAGKLCRKAIDEINQEQPGDPKILFAVRLPYGVQKDAADAELALQFIQAEENLTIDIKPSVDTTLKITESAISTSISDFEKGNLKARTRMQIQYLLAGMKQLLVVGTDHAAEAITGFYTKFGDGGADLVPLYGLNKRQGKQLLEYLKAPIELVDKIPTADLEDLQPLLPDEKALGLTYQQIDDYLEGKPIDLEAQQKIEAKYLNTSHKRQMPAIPQDY